MYVRFISEPKLMPLATHSHSNKLTYTQQSDVILFDSWLEIFSKTPWYAIPIAWLPVIAYHLLVLNTLSLISSIAFACLGVFTWTLVEYCLHRFLFHGEEYWLTSVTNNNLVFVAHFLLHGIHHAFPQDKYRLVFPVLPGYAMLIILTTPFKLVLPADIYPAYVAGGIIGYVMYDMTHFFLHHV